jgi:hypothetical protein
MENKYPSGLKAMQNGALGEARAKAFLMDRFWILERSVDIDGADLIIQRRITSQNLLDKNPPKLGFVQVKFYETEKTSHYIPKAYIIDSQGNLRDEFFLLCHTGYEENSQIFFLTSEMISSDFEVVVQSEIEKYSLSGTKIFRNKKYLVQSNANTLSRIESKLALADFKRNREFISWKLPISVSDSKAILPDYNEPLSNSWGHIPNEFQKIKESALNAMKEIETIYLDLKAIAEEIDPLEAFTKIEILDGELGSSTYGHWGREIMQSLYDENFYYTCKAHKDKVEILRSDGLLDKFIKIKEFLKKNVSDFLCQNLPIDANTVHSVIIEFTDDFDIISTNHNLVPANKYFNVPNELNRFGHVEISSSGYRGIKEISERCFEYYWLAGRIYVDEKYKNALQEFYRETDFWIYNDCLDKMYELKY